MERKPRLGDVIIYESSVMDYPGIVNEILNDGSFGVAIFHPVRGVSQNTLTVEMYNGRGTLPFSWRYQDDEETQS